MDRAAPAETTEAVFALGCLWGADAWFGGVDGVVRTRAGFAGGTAPGPTHTDPGDHLEAVRVEYDADRLSYTGLLDRFWAGHDPTQTASRRRYRHALMPQTRTQAERARHSREKWRANSGAEATIQIVDDATFVPAAPHHQNYKLRDDDRLMAAFQSLLPDEEALIRSPAATLTNSYVDGARPPERLDDDRERLGLPPDALARLRTHAGRQQGWRAFVRGEARQERAS